MGPFVPVVTDPKDFASYYEDDDDDDEDTEVSTE